MRIGIGDVVLHVPSGEEWASYRKCLQELVDVKLENEAWREMHREILEGSNGQG